MKIIEYKKGYNEIKCTLETEWETCILFCLIKKEHN